MLIMTGAEQWPMTLYYFLYTRVVEGLYKKKNKKESVKAS